MTKEELIDIVAVKTSEDRGAVRDIVQATIDAIGQAIVSKEAVTIRGFGTFSAKTQKAKPARHITAGVQMMLPERLKPYFKPSPALTEQLRAN